MASGSTLSDLSEIESRLAKFYVSGEPQTTLNYPLSEYTGKVEIKNSEYRDLGLYNLGSGVDGGQIILVENALVSCECNHGRAPYIQNSYPDVTSTSWAPACPRVPEEVQLHLILNLRQLVENFNASYVDEREFLIRNLDARDKFGNPEARELVNPHGDPIDRVGFLHKKRGPWKNGGTRNVDLVKVVDIVTNNVVCEKVRSRTQEEPSQVETCELWGLWLRSSFINHSCSPNCHRMRVGDAVIIRAAVHIDSGEELTLPYFDIFEPLLYRDSAAQMCGFRCDCGRCAFERSLGQPYEFIQANVMILKQQVCKALTFKDLKATSRVVERLMEKLADQLPRIMELINDSSQKFYDPKNAQDQLSFDFDVAGWISASFIETHIAYYALCATRSSCLPDSCSIPIPTTITCRSLEAMRVWRTISSLETIRQIVANVHQGSLLGQEFYVISFEASNELVQCDLDENLAANMDLVHMFYRAGVEFYSKYYGFAGDGIIGLLMETKS